MEFQEFIGTSYDICFPLKRVRLRKIDKLKPWLCDDSYLKKVKEKNNLYRCHHSGNLTQVELDTLKALTSEVTKLQKKLKYDHFARKIEKAGKDSRTAWRVIHDFLGKPGRNASPCRVFAHNGGPVPRDAILESFCRFFTRIGTDLADWINPPPRGSFRDTLGPP